MPLTPGAQALSEVASHPLATHSRTVAELAAEVGAELGLPLAERQEIEMAALLHDIGKLELMDHILDKPNGLTDAELGLVRQHPARGQAMLERAGEHFTRIGRIVRSCHERWDGAGYPDALAGEEIPLAARIVFCCDAYEAMTSDRPYRDGIGLASAIRELWSCAGTQFDPKVVAALVRALARSQAREVSAETEASPQAPRASARATSGSAARRASERSLPARRSGSASGPPRSAS